MVSLRAADQMPDYPDGVGQAGAELWRKIWDAGATWISPDTDLFAARRAVILVDAFESAAERYRVTGDHRDAGALVKLSHDLASALSSLGFDPVSRSRLGVAEVKRVSKLDELRRRNVIDAEVS